MKHSSGPQDNSGLFLALAWPKQLNDNPKPGCINSHKLTMKRWQHYTVSKQGRSLILNLGQKKDINADHKLIRKRGEPYTVHSWGRSRTPSIDKVKLGQQMWKSTANQHPRAHSTQLLNANAKESYTDRNGKRTNSQSICV